MPSVNALRFTPYSWAKLLHMMELAGKYEIAFMGESHPDDKLLVEDVHMVLQENQPAHVEFDDDALAQYMDQMSEDFDVPPSDCMRIWIHTHPGFSPDPSFTDKDTFEKKFGDSDFAVMCIITGQANTPHFARLKVNVSGSFCVEQDIPVQVAWNAPFQASDARTWDEEFKAAFRKKVMAPITVSHSGTTTTFRTEVVGSLPPYAMGGATYTKEINGEKVVGRYARVYNIAGYEFFPDDPGYAAASEHKDARSYLTFQPLLECQNAGQDISDEERAAQPGITLSSNAPLPTVGPSDRTVRASGPKPPDAGASKHTPEAVARGHRHHRRVRGLGSKLRTNAGVDGHPAFPPG